MNGPFRILIVIDIGWPLKRHLEVYAGIEEVAEVRGWDSTLLSVPENIEFHRRDWAFDGIVGRITEGVMSQTSGMNIPTVNLWLNSPATSVFGIYPDWHAAGTLAAEHFLSRGISNVAYLGMRDDLSSNQQSKAIQTVLEENQGAFSKQLVDPRFDQTQRQWDRFSAQIDRWIDTWTPPVGLCVMDDLLGRHLVSICKHRELDVPGDVAILCSQNEPLVCESSSPRLSSIEMGFRELGRTAAHRLGQLMQGEAVPERRTLLPPVELIQRQSTDVYAVNDPVVAGALQFISDHCHTPIKVTDVVAKAAVSRRNLERRFQKMISRTIACEITRLRIERTKHQLIASDSPIKLIAFENGFRDTSHLCKVFLRETGSSPTAWRLLKKGF